VFPNPEAHDLIALSQSTSLLKQAGKAAADGVATKDSIYKLSSVVSVSGTLLAGGISVFKDTISPAKTVTAALDQFLFMSGQMIEVWNTAAEAGLQQLFSGTQDAYETLYNIMDDGALLDDLDNDEATGKAAAKKALWSTLIPWAWALSNDEHHPFIMYVANNPFQRGTY
jgi:hypothetical protein